MGILAFLIISIPTFFYTYKKGRVEERKEVLYYIIVSLISVSIFAILNIGVMNTFKGITLFSTIPILLSIAWYDAKEKQIDVKLMLMLLGISVISIINYDILYPVTHILTAALFFVLMFIVNKVSKNGIGFGDIKLMPILALLLGLGTMLKVTLGALFIMLIAGIVSIIRKKARWKDSLPFAPYLYIAFVLCAM